MSKVKRQTDDATVIIENFGRKLEEAKAARDARRATFDQLAAQRALFGKSHTGLVVSEDDERNAWADVQDAERTVAALEAAKLEAERRREDAVEHDRAADEDDLWDELERAQIETEPALNEVVELASKLGAAAARYFAPVDQLADRCPEIETRFSGGRHRRKVSARNSVAYVLGHYLGDIHEDFRLPAIGPGLDGTIKFEQHANETLGTRHLTPPAAPATPKRGLANAILNAISGGKAA